MAFLRVLIDSPRAKVFATVAPGVVPLPASRSPGKVAVLNVHGTMSFMDIPYRFFAKVSGRSPQAFSIPLLSTSIRRGGSPAPISEEIGALRIGGAIIATADLSSP